ncbi:glucuronate isomerase [Friedmanniella luteola]|uniref:Uronate isomerase n=1 Tax=Friedmanniella luteola TaxID=546871 RepID=A0A1H1SE15_9ACTN|nr:glucuronate isomerase [Friedmanniella luteola]SDS46113.1 glucuronate isomerase [Friedmanniella luteola]
MPPATAVLQLHPDRLLPADPEVRAIARRLHASVADLPVVSPHGHVPAAWLADDTPFVDPTSLLVTPDHYVNRLLHAHGVELSALGVGQGPLEEEQSRAAFRTVCAHWDVFRGTPVRYWFESQLADIFGVEVRPSAATADAVYDQVAACLVRPEFRPRALHDRFGITVLATTDDPCDDLAAHRRLTDDPSWTGRVVPTFRPDRYLEAAGPTWNADLDRLAAVSGVDTGDYAGFIEALEDRRRHFRAHGAVSTDHSHPDVRTDVLEPAEAARLFTLGRRGEITAEEATALRRHLLAEMARMSVEDGLVMTLHPGIRRNHHTPTFERYGADVGSDIPVALELTDALRPLLSRYGTAAGFHLVLFTVDETVFSREIAPLAGFYPSVFAGAPWWFLDAPEAIRRYRGAVTESAGFAKTSGFIDDTRAFCSIPARHDMSRRLDAGYLAGLVAEHRLDEDEALETAHDLVVTIPERTFKL